MPSTPHVEDGRNRVLVVIPAFNEASHVPELLDRIRKVHPLEDVLIVDDGSTDETASLAEQAGVRVLRNPQNLGKGASLYRGFQWALQHGYDGVITMDADLQHPPELIPRFLEKARMGYDVVVGSRFHDFGEMPWDRYFSNRSTTLVLSLLTHTRLQDTQSGYRYLSARFLRVFRPTTRRFDFESEVLYQAALKGFKIGYVPMATVYGQEESSIHKVWDTVRFILLAIRLLWR